MAAKKFSPVTVFCYRSEGSDSVAYVVIQGGRGGVVCVGRRGLVYEAGEDGIHENCC